MNNSITDQIRSLEELAFNAEVEDEWVKKCLDFLSIQWNQVMASSLHNYLLLMQPGNYFLQNFFEIPTVQNKLEGEIILGKVLGSEQDGI